MEDKNIWLLGAIHKDLWKIVEVGCDIPDDDETPKSLTRLKMLSPPKMLRIHSK
jgi:hypothetical protein